jgi:hypothetical protein
MDPTIIHKIKIKILLASKENSSIHPVKKSWEKLTERHIFSFCSSVKRQDNEESFPQPPLQGKTIPSWG